MAALYLIGFLWMFLFLVFGPYWQMLLTFIPLAIFAYLRTDPIYHPLLIPVLLPLFVFDIQVIDEDDWNFRGAWRLLSWLPGVILLIVLMFLFPPTEYSGSIWTIIWKTLVIAAFTIILTKLWVGDPLTLLLNRLRINDRHTITYKVVTIEAKKQSRAFSYFIISSSNNRLEVSGFVYLYLLIRGVRKGGLVTINYKTGWLGVTFATGFPGVSQLS